jgi:homopolymeric O-antigen transport system ATP-binding protein
MSSELAVQAEGVSKRYRLGERESYRALRDVLAGAFTAPLRRFRESRDMAPELWALDDVSFALARGEVLGLIGSNGAGKSTLLKVLSRITEPTRGRVVLRGRVGSLLEVGTGFHPELTGRENIFLNGTVLGMRRAEIVRRFDEIVEFAGVEKFLDTPVKRYSSGMQVRLAFAVAAHLEPEILLVDEVLAVGDVSFQEKCLGKMRDVTREGRTVVFVSHNLAAVRSLCSRALVLESGKLVFDGPTDDAVHRYLAGGGGKTAAVVEAAELELRAAKERVYADRAYFRCTRIAAVNEAGAATTSFDSDEPASVEIDFTVLRPLPSLRLLLTLTDENQVPVLRSESIDGAESFPLEPGDYQATVTLPAGLFGEVELDLNVSLIAEVMQVADYAAVMSLEFRFAGHGTNMRGKAYLRPRLSWSVETLAPVDSFVD